VQARLPQEAVWMTFQMAIDPVRSWLYGGNKFQEGLRRSSIQLEVPKDGELRGKRKYWGLGSQNIED
jgi:hypothetical protein